jgi:hypothetical protein
MCREPEFAVVPTKFWVHIGFRHEGMTMWNFADRMVRAVSDVTVGTVIVLVHVALADRTRKDKKRDRDRPQQLSA